jgi:hypothetical protein
MSHVLKDPFLSSNMGVLEALASLADGKTSAIIDGSWFKSNIQKKNVENQEKETSTINRSKEQNNDGENQIELQNQNPHSKKTKVNSIYNEIPTNATMNSIGNNSTVIIKQIDNKKIIHNPVVIARGIQGLKFTKIKDIRINKEETLLLLNSQTLTQARSQLCLREINQVNTIYNDISPPMNQPYTVWEYSDL